MAQRTKLSDYHDEIKSHTQTHPCLHCNINSHFEDYKIAHLLESSVRLLSEGREADEGPELGCTFFKLVTRWSYSR